MDGDKIESNKLMDFYGGNSELLFNIYNSMSQEEKERETLKMPQEIKQDPEKSQKLVHQKHEELSLIFKISDLPGKLTAIQLLF